MKNKVFIIAEAGVNHNGRIDLALKMCDAAKDAGCDAVKFQTFDTENNILPDCQMAGYQKKNTGGAKSQWDMLKKLELTYTEFKRLKRHCGNIGIEFLSTPSEERSLFFLLSLGLKKIKISSGEVTNYPFLRKIGGLKKKVILSTGMATLKEVKEALDILIKAGTKRNDITVLHCNTAYPTLLEDVNLLAMLTIKEKFEVNIGYSDHTQGLEVSVAAAALGAKIIEKHFTLNKKMNGPDHKASLEPGELKAMVTAIRNIEKALGGGVKKPSSSEFKNMKVARKSIVAKTDINKGSVFTEKNLTVKRPAKGLSPMEWNKVLKKKAKKDFKKDKLISL